MSGRCAAISVAGAALLALALSVGRAPAAENTWLEIVSKPCDGALTGAHLYRTVLVRAAPGRLLDLIDRYREATSGFGLVDGAGSYLIRHSQGDQWDLFMLSPMSSLGDRDHVDTEFEESLDPLVAWREEVFVCGPPIESVDRAFDGAGLLHVEMFLAIPESGRLSSRSDGWRTTTSGASGGRPISCSSA